MPPRKNKGGLLARVNFPLYTVQMLTSRHVLVGGGGGSANCGVANGFEIFELSHDGIQFIAEEVTRYETGRNVVMNCATYSDGKKTWIVAGQESHCQLYKVHAKIITIENNGNVLKKLGENTGLRHRIKGEKSENHVSSVNERIQGGKDFSRNFERKKLQLIVKTMDSIQTDFNKGDESLQKIVRVSHNGKFMATGGMDGCVKIWKFPQLINVHDLEAHTREIDHLDFSPDGNLLVSVSKDDKAIIWSVKSGLKYKELTWDQPGNNKYTYKRCLFKKSDERDESTQLFTLSNAADKKNPSFLQLWNVDSGLVTKFTSFQEPLSALAVSDNGRFVAVGTMFSGTVDMFIAFSLQRVLHVPGVHNMFVTGLEFLPTKIDSSTITSNAEAAVISISVDNRICIHSLPFRYTIPIWLVIICIMLSIGCAFIFCSYLGI